MRLKIDMHSHTRGSDGWGSAEEIAENATRADLDGICITDHHHTYTKESLDVAAACRSLGIMVFHGCEYSTSLGHLLIYGVDVDHFDFGFYPDTQKVIDVVNAAGGRCVPAHPYKGYRRAYADSIYKLRGLAAIEVRNGQVEYTNSKLNLRAKKAARLMDVPGLGGSDAHNPRDIGVTYTEFHCEIRSYLDLINAIDAEAFRPVVSRKRIREIKGMETRSKFNFESKLTNYEGEYYND